MGTPKHLLLSFRKFSSHALLIAIIPRVLPWARSFCPFRACCLQKKLDISFQVTRFQIIFGEKEQSVKSVTVVTVVTVFSGGVHAFPLLSICKYYIYTYIFIFIYKYKYISNF